MLSRYLNSDLTLNHPAIRQAAEAEARARVQDNANVRAYLASRGFSQVDRLTDHEALDRALARYYDIARGQQANELFFRDGVAVDQAQAA